jgi:chloramphenicol-sensitive protein RarD
MSAAGDYDPANSGQQRAGLACALAANILWGALTPIYFKALGDVPGLEVLAHRIIWSALPLFGLYLARRRATPVTAIPRGLRIGLVLAITALLLGANWLTYVHAVATHQMVQASLGYFLAPLVTVLLSVVFLREHLSMAQVVAVGLAGLGALNLCWSCGGLPWVALVISVTFALYTLLRKKLALDAVTGLLGETATLLVPAGLVLVYATPTGTQHFGSSWGTTLLLMGTGGLTIVPLLAYAGAVRRLRLSTLGVMQYLAPTFHLLLAVLVYGEPLSRTQLVSFALIWAAVLLYALRGVWSSFQGRRALAAAYQAGTGFRRGILRRPDPRPVVSQRHCPGQVVRKRVLAEVHGKEASTP